jgi:hypothetical protein
MKLTKCYNALSALVIVAGVGLLIWTVRARQSARAAEQDWAKRERGLQAAKNRAERSLAESNHALIALRAAAAQPAPTESRKRPMDWSAFLAKHPELQVAFEKAFSAQRAQSYGPLYRRLQLSGGQIDQLDQLMAKDVENSLDVDAVAQARNLPRNDPAIVQMRQAQQDELNAQEKAIVGPEAFSSLQVFEAEGSVRSLMGVANSTAVASEAGMTYDQEDQLARVAAQVDPVHQTNPTQTVDRTAIDWDAATAAAQNSLTPAQLASLQAEAAATKFIAQTKQFFRQQSAPAK